MMTQYATKPAKRIKLVDYPVYVPEVVYSAELSNMIDCLSRLEDVHCIYQIGSVTTPGVSDIDLFVVFEDRASTDYNPLAGLDTQSRYLFNHGPFAATYKQMEGVQRFTFFHNYQLLWGDKSLPGYLRPSGEEVREIKYQTALEYLLKMYISMTVERTLKIIKVRGLLLHVKALLYDLEFMDVSTGALYEELLKIVAWRNNWFDSAPDDHTLIGWHNKCYTLLGEFLDKRLTDKAMYLPVSGDCEISRNIIISKSEEFRVSHHGLVLPALIGGLSRKFFNLQYRFNRFRFMVPVTDCAASSILDERYRFLADVQRFHRINMPKFLLPGSSLAIF